ncbi:MAG: helix-turn-helix domain-containing protein [Myxococcota bacterium]
MQPEKKPSGSKKPRGKEAVVDAVQRAAAELFAERGPAATSSREIAERAGVNYGLIHRHFGSREELIRTVMTRMAVEFRESFGTAIASGKSPFQAASEHPAYARALARAALDGLDVTEVQSENPLISNVLSLLATTRGDGEITIDDRIAVAMLSLSVLGWAVFGPFVRDAVQLNEVEDAEVAERIEAMVSRLLSG